jgi:uncharacterized flavoprotein (TIGR03862 family)
MRRDRTRRSLFIADTIHRPAPGLRSDTLLNTPAKIAVIGAGPAGLMAAETMAQAGCSVRLFDAMASAGRKFLLAGRGGLNLTHSEDFETFLSRYGAVAEKLRPAIEAFPPVALRQWCDGLGEASFVGTSGRVFPKSFKASPLLRAWLRRLATLNVTLHPRHRWVGWDADGVLRFETPEGALSYKADATVLALGGASWPRLGSDGGWMDILAKAGIPLSPLGPSNCGFGVGWSEKFRARFAGEPIKGAAFSCNGRTVRGEAVITDGGIEGTAIYALSPDLRDAVLTRGEAIVRIALRPDLAPDDIAARLRRSAQSGKPSLATLLRKALKMPPVAVGLLYEDALLRNESLSAQAPDVLAARINNVPIRLTSIAPIARAISTAGGVLFDAIDSDFMLCERSGVFVAGEMLDWEAPTGGYLLQASFATGVAAGRGALKWLDQNPRPVGEG